MKGIDYTQTIRRVGRCFVEAPDGVDPFEGHTQRRLTDEAYAEVLDGFVVACVDLVFVTPDGRIVLGDRDQEPQKDPWVFGGRRFAADLDDVDSAIRITRREAGFAAARERFSTPIFYGDYVWSTRAQGPGGCHMITTVLAYFMTEEEWAVFSPNGEYAEICPMLPEDILGAPEGTYHPAVLGMAQGYLDYVRAHPAP